MDSTKVTNENCLLSAEGISIFFGGLKAIDDLTFGVREGELVGLVGPNGAGKTTCFNTITGFLKPSAGHVFFDGEDITGLPPYKAARKGLRRTFQLPEVFRGTTVLDNVLFGLHQDLEEKGVWQCISPILRLPRFSRKEERARVEAAKVLDFVNLKGKNEELTGNLASVDMRLLQLAIALVSKPRLLLVDELAAGMEAEETMGLAECIRAIAKTGVGVILVDHNMRFVMNLCERVIVLVYGKKIAEGTPGEITSNEKVREAYLGYS